MAARTMGMLGTILEFARRNRIVAENAARGARRFPDEKRRRFLSLDELAALGKAMREAEAEGENRTGIASARALILTGCRKMEVLALPWEWLGCPRALHPFRRHQERRAASPHRRGRRGAP